MDGMGTAGQYLADLGSLPFPVELISGMQQGMGELFSLCKQEKSLISHFR